MLARGGEVTPIAADSAPGYVCARRFQPSPSLHQQAQALSQLGLSLVPLRGYERGQRLSPDSPCHALSKHTPHLLSDGNGAIGRGDRLLHVPRAQGNLGVDRGKDVGIEERFSEFLCPRLCQCRIGHRGFDLPGAGRGPGLEQARDIDMDPVTGLSRRFKCPASSLQRAGRVAALYVDNGEEKVA